MKKYFYVLAIMLMQVALGEAQSYLPMQFLPGWRWISPVPPGESYTNAALTKAGIVLYYGAYGVRSTDGGNTWTQFKVGLNNPINSDTLLLIKNPPSPVPGNSNNALQFINDSVGFYWWNGLYKTTDGGLTWSRSQGPLILYGSDCYAHMLNEKCGFVYYPQQSQPSKLLMTNDTGKDWREIDSGAYGPIVGYSVWDSLHIWVSRYYNTGADSGYEIYKRTTDGGRSWDIIARVQRGDTSDHTQWIYRATYYDSLHGVDINSVLGYIQHTSDGGKTWISYPDTSIISVDPAWTVDSQGTVIVVTLESPYAYFSTSADFGKTWQTDTFALDASSGANGIHIINRDTAITAGASGFFFMTTDHGKSWFPPQSIASKGPIAPFFLDKKHGFCIFAWNSPPATTDVARTSDEGRHWNFAKDVPINTFNPWWHYYTGHFITFNDTTRVWFSADTGDTFKEITTLPSHSSPIANVGFTDSVYGWLFTYCGGVWRTADGGKSWAAIIPENDSCHYDPLAFYSTPSILSRDEIFTIDPYLVHTTNDGKTWDTITNNFNPSALPYDEYFITSNHGYWTSTRESYETRNGGKTWVLDTGETGIFPISGDSLFGWNENAWTIDGGITWHIYGDFGGVPWWFDTSQCLTVGSFLTSNDLNNPSASYTNGIIFYGNFDTVQVGVAEPPAPLPTTTLLTNYPNPFSGTTNIELQMPIEEQGTLKVYDMLGREVADLSKQAVHGSTTVQFNAEGLQPGVYFCKGVFGAQSFTSKLIVVR